MQDGRTDGQTYTMKIIISFLNIQISNLITFSPVGAELFCAGGTDGWTDIYDEDNSLFSEYSNIEFD